MEQRQRDTHQEPLSPSDGATGRAIVIGPYRRHKPVRGAAVIVPETERAHEARLEEATGLARAIDLDIADSGMVLLSDIRPATYIGKGKVEEIAGLVKSHEAGIVVVDCALSPVQQRNLEKAWNAKVLDRTGLILEIFGRRARTKEGTLQVELAHLNYQRSRLVRTWTHLERQRGGFGFLGGPGESQLETDRRLIGERIIRIESDLEKVKKHRKLHRDSRARVPYPIVALVGYTNAGKSTLFNRVTRASVVAADMLFATLDPTLRSVALPNGLKVILSDTVGFISELPTMLVAAFRATLEEVIEANVILHVRDVSHEDTEAQLHDVEEVLRGLGVEPNDEQRLIEVWNKIDALDEDGRMRLQNLAERRPKDRRPVLLSALTGEGIDDLSAAIEQRLSLHRVVLDLSLDPADGAGVSWLHRHTEVMEKSLDAEGRYAMKVRVAPDRVDAVTAKFGEPHKAGLH